jgi:hypothetical protein
MASTRIIDAIDEALVLFDDFKAQARSYKFSDNNPCIINFHNPADRDFYQDDATESANGPYNNSDRPAEVIEILSKYGFSDSHECSPCFEMLVRQYCREKRCGRTTYPLPSVVKIAESVRNAAALRLSRIGCGKNLPDDNLRLARDALSTTEISRLYGFHYSCCLEKVVDSSKIWHCKICKKCQTWRSWHCETCNECQFGLSIPCKKCQPDLYLARMSQCNDKHLP